MTFFASEKSVTSSTFKTEETIKNELVKPKVLIAVNHYYS
jgi:hypothetical protein